MNTTFPDGDAATLKLTLQKPKAFTLALRRPSWAGEGFTVKVNGKSVTTLPGPGSYVELKRAWKTGDTVSLVLPKTLRIEGLADNSDRAALMWGPLVLAADLGPERRGGPTEPIPSLVTDEKPVKEWLQPVPDSLGVFRTAGVGRDNDGRAREVAFSPFYRLHRRTYAVYWDLYSSDEWTKKIGELAAEGAKQQKLEATTVVFLQPGDVEKEKAFNQQGEETVSERVMGRAGRRAKKWFSFDMPVEPGKPMTMVVTYNTEERAKRSFEILVDGQRVGEGTIERYPPGSPTGRFYDLNYRLAPEVLKDKKKVTVRFQATGSNETATAFGIRIVRADER
jgi:hypothetical protein